MEPIPVRCAGRSTAKHDLISRELERFRAEARPDTAGLSREVRSMLGYIHEHLFDPMLSVSTVKTACGIRNNNIAMRFKILMGFGIRDYIEWLRMQAALRLLAHHHLEVFLIGLAVGYVYHESFCRTFHRLFACTPSEYRLRGLQFPPTAYDEGEMLRASVKP